MNPILQQMNKGNSILNTLNQLKKVTGGDPEAAYNVLLNSNSQFRSFVEKNKGKSPEQIARENGIDFGMIQNLLTRSKK